MIVISKTIKAHPKWTLEQQYTGVPDDQVVAMLETYKRRVAEVQSELYAAESNVCALKTILEARGVAC